MLEGPRPVGVPRKVSDPAQFLLDLTPCQERTVQRDGIEIDNMTYYDSILQRYIGARDPQHPKLARKFRCRTPIDDARVIYFQDPVTKEYHQIQCADKSMPPFTRHELKLVSRYLRAKEQKNIDMVAIKRGVEKLRQIIQETIEKRGKSAAAMSARRKKAVTQNLLESHSPLPHKTTAPESAPMPAKDYDPSEIQGF
jgi:putative transposase